MRVAAKIINTDYLWNKLRVTGGAYGGFASISLMGNIIFSSYRDPNLTETLDVYDKSGDFFRSLNLSERDLTRFIIGTIGDYDAPMSVSSKSRVSNVYYFQNITQKDLQKIREEILAAKMEDLNSFADTLDAVNEQNIYLCNW
jgi:Zn-dependent M16 (insulinase) family peptidase